MKTQTICLFILLMTTLLGCKRENPNPELIDPIYTDLLSELRAAEQAHSDSVKKIGEAKISFQRSDPNTIDRKNAQKDLLRAEKIATRSLEMAEYYKIRAEQRKVTARRAYKEAFKDGVSWPDKNEFEAYKTNKRLVNSSRNWRDRLDSISEKQDLDK